MVARERLIPWGLGLVVFAGSLYSASGAIGVRSPLPVWLIVLMAAGSGLAAALVRERWWPILLAAAAGWVVAALWPAAIVASYQAGSRLRQRRLGVYLAGSLVVLILGLPVASYLGGARFVTTATPANFFAMLLWLVVLPLVIGLWLGNRRDLLNELRERAARLEREQAAQEERARAEERNRIAREMHDVVAHRVSLMVVHAGALEVSATDPATVETAAVIRETGREALADLREVLGVLRSPRPEAGVPRPAQSLDDLPELVRRSEAAGLSVRHRVSGAVYDVPATVGRAAYRVVQEALTNVHKHAGVTTADVAVRFQPDALDVTVHNGPPADAGRQLPGAGLGLVGLRERVELLHGELETRAEPDGGFTVRARFPVGQP
ncbi:sensor histidine kinase [Actinoplanes aureus]|uniref:histidine kinase n=1 Tax=Actinoplanes aureus TaxID=2792083 RepID=A0A931CFW0_9ACTN|nr:histidine kinase [Actinoplanes aureus]MBG0564145.1 histidine kinase [Actinoplanes aureus]